MRHLIYNVRYSVVPINSSLLTITLFSSLGTTFVYLLHLLLHHHHHPLRERDHLEVPDVDGRIILTFRNLASHI